MKALTLHKPTNMVSDFRKKKLLRALRVFDGDSSGYIEKGDFDLITGKIANNKGWKAGDGKYKEVQETLTKIWHGISQADKDKDGRISADEWIQMWDGYATNPQEWQSLYCKFIFWLQDESGDGSVNKAEFSSVMSILSDVSKAEAEGAFQKLAKGKEAVSWAEFQELWKEYFSSDDVNAPGNFLFVKYE